MTEVAFMIFLLKILPTALLASSCPSTQYSGKFRSKKYEENQAIIGHSYENLTITCDQQCFSFCVQDCKCLSFQVFGTRCELVDKYESTSSRAGYKHYPMKQHFKNKYTNIPCSGVCRNGCCRTNPCMNGGTCVETCDDVRRKFKCVCPLGIQGKYCQLIIVSCADIPGNPSPGIQTINRPSLTSQFQVYCDFTSEPHYVWTLVESFELSKKSDYLNRKFPENHPVSETSPNWVDYRMSLEDMRHIRTNATHWRVTCNFNTANISTTDYVRVSMKTIDIMQPVKENCYHIGFLRLRGNTCTSNCSARFESDRYHPFFAIRCDLNTCGSFESSCSSRYEAFGAYDIKDTSHHCSSSPTSTTNWWIGYKLN